MNTKKLLKYAGYYSAIASVYNYAVNSYVAANPTATFVPPKLPNPTAAIVNGILGANAPLMLTQTTGGYGSWG